VYNYIGTVHCESGWTLESWHIDEPMDKNLPYFVGEILETLNQLGVASCENAACGCLSSEKMYLILHQLTKLVLGDSVEMKTIRFDLIQCHKQFNTIHHQRLLLFPTPIRFVLPKVQCQLYAFEIASAMLYYTMSKKTGPL